MTRQLVTHPSAQVREPVLEGPACDRAALVARLECAVPVTKAEFDTIVSRPEFSPELLELLLAHPIDDDWLCQLAGNSTATVAVAVQAARAWYQIADRPCVTVEQMDQESWFVRVVDRVAAEIAPQFALGVSGDDRAHMQVLHYWDTHPEVAAGNAAQVADVVSNMTMMGMGVEPWVKYRDLFHRYLPPVIFDRLASVFTESFIADVRELAVTPHVWDYLGRLPVEDLSEETFAILNAIAHNPAVRVTDLERFVESDPTFVVPYNAGHSVEVYEALSVLLFSGSAAPAVLLYALQVVPWSTAAMFVWMRPVMPDAVIAKLGDALVEVIQNGPADVLPPSGVWLVPAAMPLLEDPVVFDRVIPVLGWSRLEGLARALPPSFAARCFQPVFDRLGDDVAAWETFMALAEHSDEPVGGLLDAVEVLLPPRR